MMRESSRFVKDGSMERHLYTTTNIWHTGTMRGGRGNLDLVTVYFIFSQYCNTMCWFFYFISCNGHTHHHFCLRDDNDKNAHKRNASRQSHWNLYLEDILIVLIHKCKHPTAECSRRNLTATCELQNFFFFFKHLKLSPQAKWSSTELLSL